MVASDCLISEEYGSKCSGHGLVIRGIASMQEPASCTGRSDTKVSGSRSGSSLQKSERPPAGLGGRRKAEAEVRMAIGVTGQQASLVVSSSICHVGEEATYGYYLLSNTLYGLELRVAWARLGYSYQSI